MDFSVAQPHKYSHNRLALTRSLRKHSSSKNLWRECTYRIYVLIVVTSAPRAIYKIHPKPRSNTNAMIMRNAKMNTAHKPNPKNAVAKTWML